MNQVLKTCANPLFLGFLGTERTVKASKPFPVSLSRIGGPPTIWESWELKGENGEPTWKPRCTQCCGLLTLILQVNTSYTSTRERIIMFYLCLNSEEPTYADKVSNKVLSCCHVSLGGWRVFRLSRHMQTEELKEVPKFKGSVLNTEKAETFVDAIVEAVAALSITCSESATHPMSSECTVIQRKEARVLTDSSKWLEIKETRTKYLPAFELEVEQADRSLEEGLLDDLVLHSRALAIKFKSSLTSDDALQYIATIDDQGKQNDYDESGDPLTMKLEKRISLAPEQVVRYSLGSKPLWLSTPTVGSAEHDIVVGSGTSIPNCPRCGSKRVFELQILSTMITLMEARLPGKLPPMFWGTCAAYTCSDDCWEDPTRSSFDLAEEFAAVQSI